MGFFSMTDHYRTQTQVSPETEIYVSSSELSSLTPKHGNSILAGCPPVKFPKVFIQIFICKIDRVIKIRGNRNQGFSNYY